MQIRQEKKNNIKRKGSATVYIIFFFVIFLSLATFAVDGTFVFTNRIKLQNITEQTALAAAAQFNANSTYTAADITQIATDTFNLLRQDGLRAATINVTSIDMDAQTITVETHFISQPYFLAFLGVSGINLEARARAISEILNITANYPGINWLTPSAAYRSDILSANLNMNDTAVLLPLGDGQSVSYDELTGYANFDHVETEDNQVLSLGPGGFITLRLPVPIINKPGFDLFIGEAGQALEGYLVFVGLDNDPDNPYVNSTNPGAGISWINISCSGQTDITDTNGNLGLHNSVTDSLGNQDKFYGSAYFDIGAACVGGISMAKYLRIVDDNVENGFATTDTSANTSKPYYKTMLYGEASTTTSGADIDTIQVLNHVRLQQN